MEPIAMLFDEPTSALDPEMINEVLEVMVQLALEGMTMMVVTHEMGFARKVADRVVFMNEEEIVEDTSKDQFFSAPRQRPRQDLPVAHPRTCLNFARLRSERVWRSDDRRRQTNDKALRRRLMTGRTRR